MWRLALLHWKQPARGRGLCFSAEGCGFKPQAQMRDINTGPLSKPPTSPERLCNPAHCPLPSHLHVYLDMARESTKYREKINTRWSETSRFKCLFAFLQNWLRGDSQYEASANICRAEGQKKRSWNTGNTNWAVFAFQSIVHPPLQPTLPAHVLGTGTVITPPTLCRQQPRKQRLHPFTHSLPDPDANNGLVKKPLLVVGRVICKASFQRETA